VEATAAATVMRAVMRATAEAATVVEEAAY
jgi:hypothetical protein